MLLMLNISRGFRGVMEGTNINESNDFINARREGLDCCAVGIDQEVRSDSDVRDMPRERLERLGPRSLSDQELLSIILSSGGKAGDVFSLAKSVEQKIDELGAVPALSALLEISGIGPAKASTLVAAFEFSRRRIASDGIKIRTPADIIPLVSHLADRKQETFICVSLSGAHEVIASRIVTVGLANLCQVHPREVFADPLVDRACSIIVAHNHPSGDLTPSEDDKHVTSRLQEAAKILGIKFLDHIVFSRRGYYSILCGHTVKSQPESLK